MNLPLPAEEYHGAPIFKVTARWLLDEWLAATAPSVSTPNVKVSDGGH